MVNVDAMLASLTSKQFVELRAYKQIEPFQDVRADWRAASIVQMLYNVAVDKKHQKAMKEFLLKWDDEPKRKQTWQEQQRIMMVLAAAYAKPVEDK